MLFTTGVFVRISRQTEALAVKDDDGTLADTERDGYEIKGEHAETALKRIGADGVRVDFFNAFDDDPAEIRSFLLSLVENLREQHCSYLRELINDAHSQVDNFERKQYLAIQRDATKQLVTWLRNNGHLDPSNFLKPERSLMMALSSVHPSSIHASIRRRGEWYNLDYSHQLGYGAQLVASSAVGSKLTAFRNISDTLLQDPDLEEAFGLIRQARRVIQSGVDSILQKSELAGMAIHLGEMKNSAHSLWISCSNEWGKGAGYRDRVINHHDGWFVKYNATHQKELEDMIENEWRNTLHRLSAMLDEVHAG